MKLERAHEYVLPVVATLGGVGFAFYCGKLSGNGAFGTVISSFAAIVFVLMLLIMRERVWVLIPILWPLTGRVPSLAGQPALRDVAIIGVTVGLLALRALKVIRGKPKWGALDFWTIAMLLYLLTVYIRNPVGGDVLGSDRVGGRPYLNVFVASLAYWSLARATLFSSQLSKFSFWLVLGNLVPSFIEIFIRIFPASVPIIGRFYGVADPYGEDAGESRPTPFDSGSRQYYLGGVAWPLFSALVAKYRPISLLNPLRIGRFLLMVIAVACVLKSGFRSLLVISFLSFTLASYFRRGWIDVIRISFVSFVGLLILILFQGTFIQLPGSFQRTLSFLPGKWDVMAVEDAQHSTEWRTWMWHEMMHTDKYIQSKVWGDGFGMTKEQLRQNEAATFSPGEHEIQENFMTTGQVHSGPITAIRYVGYVGLGIYLFLICTAAWQAWKLIKLSRGTPYFNLVLFICIPVLLEPFNYCVIFGSYDAAFPATLINVGMLKMLQNSLAAYKAPVPAAVPEERWQPVAARVRPRRPSFAPARA